MKNRKRFAPIVALAITSILFPVATTGVAGQLIKIHAQVHELNPDGSTGKLIASPVLSVPEGEWATFEDIEQFTVPGKYEPARIPDSKKGILGGGVSEAIPYVGNGTQMIPPYPVNFGKMDVGLKLKFRPSVNRDGSIKIEYVYEESAFEGMVPKGKPITEDFDAPFRKKPKNRIVLNNWKKMPVISTRKQTQEFTVRPRTNTKPGILSWKSLNLAASGKLPAVRFSASAERVEVNGKEKKRSPKSQIFLITRVIEMPMEAFDADLIKRLEEKNTFSDAEFQVLIRALNQKKGTDFLTAPSIMMRSGQKGKIEIIREFVFPVAYDAPQFDPEKSWAPGSASSFPVTPAKPTKFETRNIGPTVHVTPRNLGNGIIELDLSPEVIEFDSFQNFGEPLFVHVPNAFQKMVPVVLTENRIEMPVFKRQKLTTKIRIADGETIMLGGFRRINSIDVQEKVPILGDLPIIGKIGRKEYTETNERILFWFFTPQLQDPAGLTQTE